MKKHQNSSAKNGFGLSSTGNSFFAVPSTPQCSLSTIQSPQNQEDMTKEHYTILIIDDQQSICELFTTLVKKAGHTALTAQTLQEGIKLASSQEIAAILLDIRLPDGSGLDNITQLKNVPSRPEIIVVTGFADIRDAEDALTKGAFDYVQKPVSVRHISLTIDQALEYRNARLSRIPGRPHIRGHIIGKSAVLERALKEMTEAAHGEYSVLITGETGTGKELFAQAVHANSQRADEPFIVVDCAVLTDSLVENALFGHTKGAFTGATNEKEGLVALADRGTLFLDEIGELSASNQKVLLRVLETKTFRRIGSTTEQSSNFRLVAATNKNLDLLVEQGLFRSDLLFRIRSHEIHLPPLRMRENDILELTRHYMRSISASLHLEPKTISQGFIDILLAYDWPGNVRELVNLMKRSICKAEGDPILHQKNLPVSMRVAVLKKQFRHSDNETTQLLSAIASPLSIDPIPDWKNFKDLMYHETEKQYFQDLWKHFNGDVKKIAHQSGLTRSRVYSILNKYDIQNSTD